ncbi:tyrosine-type recombinase/integrase [Acidobacteria bacterium AH-259-D05]|nr:tyrosine-type recombinase/integrase [Acidobacteria bacterium AH-259-D05]
MTGSHNKEKNRNREPEKKYRSFEAGPIFDEKIGKWFYDHRLPSGRRIKRRFDTKAVASDYWSQVRKGMIKEPTKVTWGELVKRYIERSKIKTRGYQKIRYYFPLIKKFFGEKTLVKNIRASRIEEFQTYLILNQKLKPNSTDRVLSIVRAIFNYGKSLELVVENPVDKICFFGKKDERTRYLAHGEISLLINAAGQLRAKTYLPDVIQLACETGLSSSDLLGLTIHDVDLEYEPGLIKLHRQKTENPILIGMSKNVREILQRRDLKRNGSPYFFHHQDGTPVKSIKKSFKKAVKNAGLKDARFHDLRATFAVHVFRAGADVRMVMTALGHSTPRMALRYAKIASDHVERSAAMVERAFPTKFPSKGVKTGKTRGKETKKIKVG